jgi:hypothetical protein
MRHKDEGSQLCDISAYEYKLFFDITVSGGYLKNRNFSIEITLQGDLMPMCEQTFKAHIHTQCGSGDFP